MLYADQVGQSIDPASAKAGVGWLRLLTDLPTAVFELGNGGCSFESYWGSLTRTKVESVFCAQDILPSKAELFMLPYFMTKKYVAKSSAQADLEPVGARVESRVSASSLS